MATFFFDNDTSFRVVGALRALVDPGEHTLLALRDRYAQNTKDVVWIPEAGRNGWIVTSRDHNQRRRTAEREALKEHGVIACYIRQSGATGELYTDAARIIKAWPRIAAWGTSASRGTLARLDPRDKIVEL